MDEAAKQKLREDIQNCGHERCISLTTEECDAIVAAINPRIDSLLIEAQAAAVMEKMAMIELNQGHLPSSITHAIRALIPTDWSAALADRVREAQTEMMNQLWDYAASLGIPSGNYSPVELLQACVREAVREAVKHARMFSEEPKP